MAEQGQQRQIQGRICDARIRREDGKDAGQSGCHEQRLVP